ncbi:hypothetical protein V6N13_075115 [Hibiscus sabdariffa]
MYQAVAAATTMGGVPTDNVDFVVTLDQIPRWIDAESRSSLECENEDHSYFPDPLKSPEEESSRNGTISRFPVDHEINSTIYLWRGQPWNLDVDAVVNSTNETLEEAHSSQGLHAAAGPGLAEECATLGGCRTGMAKVTKAYDLPARRVIHTVGPKYAVKYHTAAENALSHCYRSCLELLIENGLRSIAMDCIYTEAKNYPREPAAHVAIRTVRRFLEKQKDEIIAVVFCTGTSSDTEIYKRLLPLYFPRDKHEEKVAIAKLPADVGDENGETIIDERKIRIKPLPKKTIHKPLEAPVELPISDVGLMQRIGYGSFHGCVVFGCFRIFLFILARLWLNSCTLGVLVLINKAALFFEIPFKHFFVMELKLPGYIFGSRFHVLNQRSRSETAGTVGKNCSSTRYLSKANSLNLSEIAEMKIVYRGGVDSEGHPVMVIVGAHFLLRCLDLERFVLYIVKEFEPLIQKPYTILYLHSAASLQT